MVAPCNSLGEPFSRSFKGLIVWCFLLSLTQCSLATATSNKTGSLHFYKWEVEYMYSSPDGLENVVMSINGKFPGPTIRARAGDTVHVHLTNKLHTEGVVIHWHGIRQVSIH
ncbi:hypothetical protein D5086_001991 [Populus alba]|uniref:Uncharacterized protein n=1 Tax=Populus alba TaxID=43335 RepID=A0ACC4D2K1_POPAL